MPSLLDLLKLNANKQFDDQGNPIPQSQDLSKDILSPVDVNTVEPSLSPMQDPTQYKQSVLNPPDNQQAPVPPPVSKPRDFSKEQMDAINRLKQQDAISKLGKEDEEPAKKEDEIQFQSGAPVSSTKEQPEVKNLASDEQLRKLQEAARQEKQSAAYEKLGQGFLKASLPLADKEIFKHGDEVIDELNSQKAQELKDYQARVEFQKQDPSSAYSKGLRDFIKDKLDMVIPENVSAADLDKSFLNPALKAYEGEQTRESRESIAEENLKERQSRAQMENERLLQTGKMHQENLAATREATQAFRTANLNQKQELADQNKMTRLTKDINSSKAASGSALGKVQKNIDQAERMETLVDQYKGYEGKMTPAQIAELAIGLNTIFAPGTPAQGTLNKLIPSTMTGDASKIESYISNIPVGANQAAFVKNIMDTVHREKELAKKQKAHHISDFISSTDKKLFDRNPDYLNQLSETYDVNPEDLFNKNKKDKSSDSKDQKALDWAKNVIKDPKSNPEDKEDAKAILQANGVL